jgi:hypothetical protein
VGAGGQPRGLIDAAEAKGKAAALETRRWVQLLLADVGPRAQGAVAELFPGGSVLFPRISPMS